MPIKQLIKDVIAKEGGFVDHPNDKGGPTKYGITRESYREYIGTSYNGSPVTAAAIKVISKEFAAKVYEKLYYIAPGINHLPEQIQPIVFDMAVNHGPNRAIRILQRVLWDAGYNAGSVDGIVGQRTITAAGNAITDLGSMFINNIVTHRVWFYEKIIKDDPSQAVFKNGWMKRAESFRQVIA